MTESVSVSNQLWKVVDSEVYPGVAPPSTLPEHEQPVDNEQLGSEQQYEGPSLQQWNDSYDTCYQQQQYFSPPLHPYELYPNGGPFDSQIYPPPHLNSACGSSPFSPPLVHGHHFPPTMQYFGPPPPNGYIFFPTPYPIVTPYYASFPQAPPLQQMYHHNRGNQSNSYPPSSSYNPHRVYQAPYTPEYYQSPSSGTGVSTYPPSPSNSSMSASISGKHCTVWNCFKASFCTLDCGCGLCGDHLGTVIRGVQIDETSSSSEDGTTGTKKSAKVFTCIACGARSLDMKAGSNGSNGKKIYRENEKRELKLDVDGDISDLESTFAVHYISSPPPPPQANSIESTPIFTSTTGSTTYYMTPAHYESPPQQPYVFPPPSVMQPLEQSPIPFHPSIPNSFEQKLDMETEQQKFPDCLSPPFPSTPPPSVAPPLVPPPPGALSFYPDLPQELIPCPPPPPAPYFQPQMPIPDALLPSPMFTITSRKVGNSGNHFDYHTKRMHARASGLNQGSEWTIEYPRWPVIKVENIPFRTTVADLERWIPAESLPCEANVISPIHLILHRASGRTLPHCFIEMVSYEAAEKVLMELDRSRLGDRTIRVKWERRGELMRDLFSQEEYFQVPAPSLAARPLPKAPETFRLPVKLLDEADPGTLLHACRDLSGGNDIPLERPFLNIISMMSKFPWSEFIIEGGMAAQRDALHRTADDAMRSATAMSAADPQYDIFARKLRATILMCPGFTMAQKDFSRRSDIERKVDQKFSKTKLPMTPPPTPVANRRRPPLRTQSQNFEKIRSYQRNRYSSSSSGAHREGENGGTKRRKSWIGPPRERPHQYTTPAFSSGYPDITKQDGWIVPRTPPSTPPRALYEAKFGNSSDSEE